MKRHDERPGLLAQCYLHLRGRARNPTIDRVSSLLFAVGVLVTLIGLLFWARRRAASIRERAAEREQEAMAMLLASGRRDPAAAAEVATPNDVLPRPVGRLLEDDPGAKAAA